MLHKTLREALTPAIERQKKLETMSSPELSVCIPTYNAARFLPDAIGSVMHQGLDDFEIVIVDNASEDDTQALITRLSNPHIRYFRNPENLGPHHSFMRCLSEARGTYIKPLCADDAFVDEVVVKQLRVLRSRPDVAVVTCDHYLTDSELRRECIHREYPGECSGPHMINTCLSGLGNYIGGPSNIMFRRADAAGFIVDTSYKWVGDLRFSLKLLQHGAYLNVDEVGLLYRRHPNTDTAANCSPEMRMSEYLRLVEEFDWWNPFNCIQAVRRGGPIDRGTVLKRWRRACTPTRLRKALASLRDVWSMRKASCPS